VRKINRKGDGPEVGNAYMGDEGEKREVERHETLGRVPYDGGAALKQQQQVPFRSKPSGEVLTLAARPTTHGQPTIMGRLTRPGPNWADGWEGARMSLFSSHSAYLV
jgi:hypothetical protein